MAKNWIKGAIKNPGALHRKLGVPEGQKIPASKIAEAAKAGGTLGREARLAQTLSHMHSREKGGEVSPPDTVTKELIPGKKESQITFDVEQVAPPQKQITKELIPGRKWSQITFEPKYRGGSVTPPKGMNEMMKRSVHGSGAFTPAELAQGYRKLGPATDPRAGKQKG